VWGHVDFFTNNHLFKESHPEYVAARFAQYKEKIDQMIKDPEWGYEGTEVFLDAAHALHHFVPWLPTIAGQASEKELRLELEEEVRTLKRRITTEGSLSASKKRTLENQLKMIEAQLNRCPIRPTRDLLGFLMDPENTPNLPDEARILIEAVRDQNLYFQPQARTKFMNEGWASYWERELLLQPEVDVPLEYRFDLAKAWTMHERVPTNYYFDPYALGLQVFDYIDRKYGSDQGEAEVKVPLRGRDENGFLYEKNRTKTVRVKQRNRDKMLQVRRDYDDNRFLTEFLNEELFEYINLRSLDWVQRVMTQINKILRQRGWNRQLIFDPLPFTIEELMTIIETWLQAAEMATMYSQGGLGNPLFPVAEETLQVIGQVLQIVGAYDTDKHMARKQIVLRTGYHSVPEIYLVDTGRFTDGTWTLKHEYDENFGPLLQSECRDTLKYFRRLCGRPVRLLTMEIRTDWRGNPVGDPVPFEYFTEDGETVKERFL